MDKSQAPVSTENNAGQEGQPGDQQKAGEGEWPIEEILKTKTLHAFPEDRERKDADDKREIRKDLHALVDSVGGTVKYEHSIGQVLHMLPTVQFLDALPDTAMNADDKMAKKVTINNIEALVADGESKAKLFRTGMLDRFGRMDRIIITLDNLWVIVSNGGGSDDALELGEKFIEKLNAIATTMSNQIENDENAGNFTMVEVAAI